MCSKRSRFRGSSAPLASMPTSSLTLRMRRERICSRRGPALNLLHPLDQFLARAGLPLPPVAEVLPDAMPEPYRSLLVGHHDMTPTLEAFHGGRLDLRVLDRQHDGDAYRRLVV